MKKDKFILFKSPFTERILLIISIYLITTIFTAVSPLFYLNEIYYIYLFGIILSCIFFGRWGALFSTSSAAILMFFSALPHSYNPLYKEYSVNTDILFEIVLFAVVAFGSSTFAEREKIERRRYKEISLELQKVNEILNKKISQLMVLYHLSKELSSSLPLSELLHLTMEITTKIIGAETSSLWLIDKETQSLVCKAASGIDEETLKNFSMPLGEGISGWVAKYGEAQNIKDLSKDPRFKNPLRRDNIKTQLSVPLKIKENTIGVLNIFNRLEKLTFTEEDKELLTLLAGQLAITLENSRLYEEAQKEIWEKQSLLVITRKMISTVGIEELLKVILEVGIEVVEGESGSLMLVDEKEEILKVEVSYGIKEDLKGRKIKIGESISGWVAKYGEPILIQDEKDLSKFSNLQERKDVQTAICVPLKIKDKTIGVLSINNKTENRKFISKDLKVLAAIAAQADVAIERNRLYEELIATNIRTMQALAFTLDARDSYTRRHTERTIEYVIKIAKELGLSEKEINTLEYAAALHDIGKIGVPDEVLNKPVSLTKEEFEIIKKHVSISKEIISPVEFLRESIPVIYHHHERYDGKGYPAGLQGEQIPIGARILCVVDSFEAMTTDRPYRRALSIKDAINELKRWAGIQFDPEIVEIFLQILRKEGKGMH